MYCDPFDVATIESQQLELESGIPQETSYQSTKFYLTQNHWLHSIDLVTMNSHKVYSNTGNTYEIYSITAISEKEVHFHAFHLPTASVVYGIINAMTGDMLILDHESVYGNEIHHFLKM